MEKPKILIVEDEEKIARLLEIELTYEGYEVCKALDGLEGFKLFQEQVWDLILLDVMLPGLSGIELLRRIRSTSKSTNTPVIMLTAKNSVEDKVSGLDFGANDYVTKPFQIEELLARIRVALRFNRLKPALTEVDEKWLAVSDLKLNELTHEVTRNNERIDLTPREFELLAFLMKHTRQVLNREQLLNGVWGYDYFGDTNIVDVYIRYLRNKIDKPYRTSLIHTIRGVGYVLKEA